MRARATRTVKRALRDLARRAGVEVRRRSVLSSPDLRLLALIDRQGIDLVLDVGANRGQYGRHLRALGYQGRILSYEPLSEAHATLTQAAAGDAAWEVGPRVAVGAEAGTVTLNVAGNSASSSVLGMLPLHVSAAPHSAYVGKEEVRLERLDVLAAEAVARHRGRTLLKVDVQGYERPVLEGAAELLSDVTAIQSELSLAPLYEGQPLLADMVAYLAGLGFELHSLGDGFTDAATGRMLQVDGLFCRA